MAAILTMENQIQCPHGGMAVCAESNNSLLFVDDVPAVLETDTFVIAGCPFVAGAVPSPCVTIQWLDAADLLTVNGVGVLLESSTGLCLNAAGAPQGEALVMDSTPEVDAV